MFYHTTRASLSRISGALLALTLLLSACNVPTITNVTRSTPVTSVSGPTQIATLIAPTAANPTQPPTTPAFTATAVTATTSQGISVDVSGVAQDVTTQVIPAVPASADGPYWETLPQYTQLTLQGYPISAHLMQPRIFVYPAGDLAAANQAAGKIAVDLKALIQSHQIAQYLPFLPLYNAAQVLHAQVKYLDFKNGTGLRYLTQFDQAVLPINNNELLYTYQGLTSDGKYYVAAVLPVNLATLPADSTVTGREPPEFTSDFPKYLANTTATLNQQPPASFTPDLSKLDTMLQSVEIK